MQHHLLWACRALVAAAASCAAIVVLLPVATAQPDTSEAAADNTSWRMRGEPGDYISQGRAYAYDGANRISATGSSQSVRVSVASWQAWFDAPEGEVLEPGIYENATRSPFHDDGAGLSIFGDGRGCNELTGSFIVHEATYDEDDQLQAFSVTFVQHCEGHDPALYGSIAWHATEAAEPIQPALSLTAPKRTVGFGDRVTLSAHISPDSPIRTLSVYARLAGGRQHLVKTGQADARGDLEVTVSAVETTTYVVELDGNDQVADMSASTRVKVSARVVPAMKRFERRSGQFHLYKAAKAAFLQVKVSPNHAGGCVVFRAEFQLKGHWGYPSTTKCVHLSIASTATARLRGDPAFAGIPVRLRAEWGGDTRNSASASPWRYVKFVR